MKSANNMNAGSEATWKASSGNGQGSQRTGRSDPETAREKRAFAG